MMMMMMMMMISTILNTARDSDDQHSANTTVARPRPIASRDYRTTSIREMVIGVPIASNSRLLNLLTKLQRLDVLVIR